MARSNLKEDWLIHKLEHAQAKNEKEAYRTGYAGKRLPSFSSIGEDAEQLDIDRAIRVFIIDQNNEASAALIDLATHLLRPVLQEYIRGLKDGCRDNGNPHLLDMGRQFRNRCVTQQNL